MTNQQVKQGDNRVNVLGVGVSSTSMSEVLEEIDQICSNPRLKRPFFIVTAYSEFALEAQRDIDFKNTLGKSDLIVPDGVSLVAASDYLSKSPKNIFSDLISGLWIGIDILQGKYAKQTVSGVGLTKNILQSKHRVFLLGGWNGVAERLAKRYGASFDNFDDEEQAIKKMAKAKPDVLLVALGHFKQEKWIAKNLDRLECKVVVGVGSSFDEIMGEGVWSKPTPSWVRRMGLKWLWRACMDPRHIVRAWHAFPVFAWKVFLQKIK